MRPSFKTSFLSRLKPNKTMVLSVETPPSADKGIVNAWGEVTDIRDDGEELFAPQY